MHLVVFGRLINFELQIIFASLCTFALSREHAARLERERLNAEIAELSKKVERLRLSRDIHDSVGHFMTSPGRLPSWLRSTERKTRWSWMWKSGIFLCHHN
jgi:signal transduction histidine kinase